MLLLVWTAHAAILRHVVLPCLSSSHCSYACTSVGSAGCCLSTQRTTGITSLQVKVEPKAAIVREEEARAQEKAAAAKAIKDECEADLAEVGSM